MLYYLSSELYRSQLNHHFANLVVIVLSFPIWLAGINIDAIRQRRLDFFAVIHLVVSCVFLFPTGINDRNAPNALPIVLVCDAFAFINILLMFRRSRKFTK